MFSFSAIGSKLSFLFSTSFIGNIWGSKHLTIPKNTNSWNSQTTSLCCKTVMVIPSDYRQWYLQRIMSTHLLIWTHVKRSMFQHAEREQMSEFVTVSPSILKLSFFLRKHLGLRHDSERLTHESNEAASIDLYMNH